MKTLLSYATVTNLWVKWSRVQWKRDQQWTMADFASQQHCWGRTSFLVCCGWILHTRCLPVTVCLYVSGMNLKFGCTSSLIQCKCFYAHTWFYSQFGCSSLVAAIIPFSWVSKHNICNCTGCGIVNNKHMPHYVKQNDQSSGIILCIG